MNSAVALKLDRLVVGFLVDRGALPGWADKARPSWEAAAEARLHKKLAGLFDKAFDRLFDEVKRRGFGADQNILLVRRALHEATEKAPDAIWPESREAAGHGRHIVEAALREAGLRVRYSSLTGAIEERLHETVFLASKTTMERLVVDAASVTDTLAGAVREGLGMDEAARRLRDSFAGMQENRLRSIARTEIHCSQGFGNHETMREYGVEYKQWLTAMDDDVRSSHIMLHGVVMRVDEQYPNGLDYPGDRNGPIGEWIQCRCRQRPYLPRRGEIITSTPYLP